MLLAGRYELVDRLGEGGMAEVWLATAHGEAGFTRRVAIKQLFPRDGDGGAFERMFLDEARITSRLHHASIVSILDFGVEAGRPFQVLELVEGFDAWRLVKWGREQGKPIPVGLALHLCAVVGHALHFAHVAVDDGGAPLRIVHRDVSPQNVLVSRSGDVKLSDFGIAFAEGRTEKTVGGVARGKPAYMAPEQAVRGPMDGRTDVFGLGCVLHALLAGESALRDENSLVDLLAGVELKLDPSLPEPVREVIARATRRNKAERYETAEAMAVACTQLITTFLTEEPRTALSQWVKQVSPVAVHPERSRGGTPSRATPKPKRRWWPLAALATAAVITATFSLSRALGGPSTPLGVNGASAQRGGDGDPSTPVGENGASTRVGENGAPSSPVGVSGASTPVGVNGASTPVGGNGASTPLGENGASTPVGGNGAPSTPLGVNGASTPVGGAAVAQVKKPVTPTATGVLTVGGEVLLRGEVFVDGVSRGFAPTRLELTVGPHRVEIIGRDGVKHGPRELTVNRQHTESSPLAWEE